MPGAQVELAGMRVFCLLLVVNMPLCLNIEHTMQSYAFLTPLFCRLRRDLQERGRTVESVLTQYLRHVREGYLQFVAPMMTSADIIIPRARENTVAIEMLVRDLKRLRPRETTTQAAPMSTTSCLRSE